MSQRILVFENDPAFAEEVKSSFERMGALVQVATDGPSGLELAAGQKPDLILLTIELPGMNGFLVCKKIKKTVELENVPLVILSSEVDEETFEQHKKLRTRADDYIRKPIAFTDLLERVKPLVPINGQALSESGSDADSDPVAHDDQHADAISVADDEVLVLGDDDETHAGDTDVSEQHRSPPLAAAAMATDAELPDDDRASVEIYADGSAQVGSSSDALSEAAYDDVAVDPALVAGGSAPPSRGRAPASAETSGELERLRRELTAAEEKVQAADKRATAAEQRASASEKALDAAKRTGGVSSRELLDMREQLNRKERELLELRGQVTGRDKQLIDASEHALVIERGLQDSRDKLLDLQRELEKKNELVAALTTDKDASKKRLDDAKARIERAEAKVKELGLELDDSKARHQAELESLRSQHAAADQALRDQQAAALTKLTSEQEAASEQAKREYDAALADAQKAHAGVLEEQRREHTTELERTLLRTQEEHASVLEAQRQAHESAQERATEEQTQALEQLNRDHAAALERTREEHAEVLERARKDSASVLDSTKQEHASALERSAREHAEALERLRQEHAQALERLHQDQAAAFDASQRAHEEELSELREEHGVAQKVAADAAEQDKQAALGALTANYEGQLHELQLAQDAERDRIHRKHSTEISELSDKHRQDLARLGRSLSEAEARQALLEEQKEESESARHSTEQALAAVTGERDRELARGAELSAELERLKAKLARDEETLARVQKALAIGLGLLEERKTDDG